MQNTAIIPNRIVWVDWAKTILIALVCVGHFAPPETQKLLIWGCHMPAFFLISGYLYRRHGAWRTFVSFVVPIMFYSLITFSVHIVKDVIANGYWNYALDFGHPWYRIFGQYFVRIRNNPYGDIPVMGMWFVIGLMVCRFISGDIKCFSFTLRYRYITLVCLFIWLTIEPILWDYISVKDIKLYYGIYAMPFFLSGYIVKDLNISVEDIHPWIILMATVIYVAITLNLPRFDMLSYQCGSTYLLFFVNAMCGSLVLFWLCTRLPKLKLIEVFSVGTLMILFLHMELDFFLRPVFHRLGITPTNTYLGASLLPWFEMVIEFLIFYYPIIWLNKHHPILLGKMSKRKLPS